MGLIKTFAVLLACSLGVAVSPRAPADVDVDVNVDVALSLQEAVKQGKVDVKVSAIGGAAGNTIRVMVKRKVPQKVRVNISPGTVFVAVGGKVQNMTGGTVKGEFTRGRYYRPGSVMVLVDDAEHSFLVESFCLDYHKPAPKRGHAFSLALHDERAKRILKAPKDASVSVWAYQAALWMDRAGVSEETLLRRFPKHITQVEVRAARGMLRHAERTGIAGIPEGISTEVRVHIEKLFSSSPAVRSEAVRALRTMGDRASPALPLVAVNVIDPRTGTTRVSVPAIPQEAARWMEALGIPELNSLIGGLGAGPNGSPGEVTGVLGAIRDARVQRFTAMLKDPNWRARQRAARVLATIPDARVVEPLIATLNDDDGRVQQEAADALGKVTGKDFGKDHHKWQAWWEKNKETFFQGN